MSERETCWLVVENGEEFWGGNRTVPAITEAKRYIASEARVVAETLNAVFGGYDWQAVQHTFDPPKTPGQRFYEAARWFSAPRPEWGQLSIECSAKYELAAAEFLADEPKAESVEAKHAADVLAQIKGYCEKITLITPAPYGSSESVAKAVAREREACVKIAERPIPAGESIPCNDPMSFASGFKQAQALIVNAIRVRELLFNPTPSQGHQ